MSESKKEKEYRNLRATALNPDGTPKKGATPDQIERLNQLKTELEAVGAGDDKPQAAAGETNDLDGMIGAVKLKKLEEKIFTKDGKVRAGVTQKQIIDYHLLKKEAEGDETETEFDDRARVEHATKTTTLNVRGEQVTRTYVPRK